MTHTTDYNVVKAELERRGMWTDPNERPNRTSIAVPTTLEIFYVQKEPRMAAWAQYEREADLFEAYANITVRHLNRSDCNSAK